MAWEEARPQSGTEILLLQSFVFVSPDHICICLLFPLLYLSDQVTFVFVSPNYSCICLLILLLHFFKTSFVVASFSRKPTLLVILAFVSPPHVDDVEARRKL